MIDVTEEIKLNSRLRVVTRTSTVVNMPTCCYYCTNDAHVKVVRLDVASGLRQTQGDPLRLFELEAPVLGEKASRKRRLKWSRFLHVEKTPTRYTGPRRRSTFSEQN